MRILINKSLTVLAVATSIISTAAACSRNERQPELPEWSVSFRWTSADGVDLDSPWAMGIRAAIESNTIAEFLSMENGYPGWSDLPGAVDISASKPHEPVTAVGTAYLHLIKYRTSAGIETAVVCKDMTQVAGKDGDRFPLPNPDSHHETLEAINVDVGSSGLPPTSSRSIAPTETPPGPTLDGPPGRAARPEQNVFLFPVWVYYPHGRDHYRNVCESWDRWRSVPAAPQRDETTPPPVEPYFPGWSVG